MRDIRQWTIGRSPDCDLVVNQPAASARHCRLTQTADGFFVEDLQSSNGTYVNGRPIVGQTPVSRADQITLGQTTPMPWPDLAPAKDNTRAIPSGVITIGRAADNQIVLEYPMVSAHHARVQTKGGQTIIEDLGSSNGTAIGAPHKKIKRAPLEKGDIVFFGSLRVPASRLLQDSSQDISPPKTISAIHNSITIGRSPDCDQVLNYPVISSRHARLYRDNAQLMLEDLQSTNGTFLNGQPISEPVAVNPGDVIGLGSFTLTLQANGSLQKRDQRGDVTVEAQRITVDVPRKRLIADCSFTIYPSELVGLMGPSGAGKTTLMRAINGYTPPTDGRVLVNGVDLYQHFDRYRLSLGYVPQDDIIHSDLTVFQALFYSARLRLPPDFSNNDIKERIQTVLKQLHLEGVEKVLIGSPERKGISGGQRKRVNLAMELLTDPLVLFLDEPTSGLSSEDALVVMKVLRELADRGKTILITIHQPSLEAYQLMDNLLLVGKDTNTPEPGRIIYYGRAFPNAIAFFRTEPQPGANLSPDEIFRNLPKKPCVEWSQQFQQSREQREYVQERASKPIRAADKQPPQKRWSPLNFLLQWWTLTRRCLAIKIKDRVNSAILLAQAPVIAGLIVLVFGKQTAEEVTIENWAQVGGALGTALFMITLAALWFGASNAVREIVGEWAIWQRERMVNLGILPYLASKFTVLGGLSIIQCFVLLLITGWGCALQSSWTLLMILILFAAFIGIGIGLTLSALARSSEMAIALLPIVLLAIVVLGGGIQPIHQMHNVTQVLSSAAPARWAFEGMMVAESNQRPRLFAGEEPTMPPDPTKIPTKPAILRVGESAADFDEDKIRDMAESYFPAEDARNGLIVDLVALLVIFSILIGAIMIILRWRDIH